MNNKHFRRDIYNSTTTLKEADKDQKDLLVDVGVVVENLYALFEGRERVLNASDSKIFPIKTESTNFSDTVLDHSNLKIWTSKQMPQGLPIALTTFDNLLYEIRQIIYSLYQVK